MSAVELVQHEFGLLVARTIASVAKFFKAPNSLLIAIGREFGVIPLQKQITPKHKDHVALDKLLLGFDGLVQAEKSAVIECLNLINNLKIPKIRNGFRMVLLKVLSAKDIDQKIREKLINTILTKTFEQLKKQGHIVAEGGVKLVVDNADSSVSSNSAQFDPRSSLLEKLISVRHALADARVSSGMLEADEVAKDSKQSTYNAKPLMTAAFSSYKSVGAKQYQIAKSVPDHTDTPDGFKGNNPAPCA